MTREPSILCESVLDLACMQRGTPWQDLVHIALDAGQSRPQLRPCPTLLTLLPGADAGAKSRRLLYNGYMHRLKSRVSHDTDGSVLDALSSEWAFDGALPNNRANNLATEMEGCNPAPWHV